MHEIKTTIFLKLIEIGQEKQAILNDFGKSPKLGIYSNSKLIELYRNYQDFPRLYIVTPTFNREHQIAELTRLKNTLWNVPKVHWIVIEDSVAKTKLITDFLLNCKISNTHLNIKTPKIKKKRKWSKHKGSAQRNLAIEWLRKNRPKVGPKDVVYFADDDNSYHLQLFEEVDIF